MIGEGGFGCVYWGTIKNLEDPSKKIEVAVKQLGKRGLQVWLLHLRSQDMLVFFSIT